MGIAIFVLNIYGIYSFSNPCSDQHQPQEEPVEIDDDTVTAFPTKPPTKYPTCAPPTFQPTLVPTTPPSVAAPSNHAVDDDDWIHHTRSSSPTLTPTLKPTKAAYMSVFGKTLGSDSLSLSNSVKFRKSKCPGGCKSCKEQDYCAAGHNLAKNPSHFCSMQAHNCPCTCHLKYAPPPTPVFVSALRGRTGYEHADTCSSTMLKYCGKFKSTLLLAKQEATGDKTASTITSSTSGSTVDGSDMIVIKEFLRQQQRSAIYQQQCFLNGVPSFACHYYDGCHFCLNYFMALSSSALSSLSSKEHQCWLRHANGFCSDSSGSSKRVLLTTAAAKLLHKHPAQVYTGAYGTSYGFVAPSRDWEAAVVMPPENDHSLEVSGVFLGRENHN